MTEERAAGAGGRAAGRRATSATARFAPIVSSPLLIAQRSRRRAGAGGRRIRAGVQVDPPAFAVLVEWSGRRAVADARTAARSRAPRRSTTSCAAPRATAWGRCPSPWGRAPSGCSPWARTCSADYPSRMATTAQSVTDLCLRGARRRARARGDRQRHARARAARDRRRARRPHRRDPRGQRARHGRRPRGRADRGAARPPAADARAHRRDRRRRAPGRGAARTPSAS